MIKKVRKHQQPIVWLAGSLFVGLSSWFMSLDSLADMAEPSKIGAALGIIGTALMAWVARAPGSK